MPVIGFTIGYLGMLQGWKQVSYRLSLSTLFSSCVIGEEMIMQLTLLLLIILSGFYEQQNRSKKHTVYISKSFHVTVCTCTYSIVFFMRNS